MRAGDHVRLVLEQWRRELPELDRRAFAVVGRLSRLAQLLEHELEPVFADHGLHSGEFDVLAALRRAGRPYTLSPTALSSALLVTSGGMTRRLTALESRRLIVRKPDPDDGRSSTVSLTRAGKELVEAVIFDHVANEDRLIDGLTNSERKELARLLEKLTVSLGDRAGSGQASTLRRRQRRV